MSVGTDFGIPPAMDFPKRFSGIGTNFGVPTAAHRPRPPSHMSGSTLNPSIIPSTAHSYSHKTYTPTYPPAGLSSEAIASLSLTQLYENPSTIFYRRCTITCVKSSYKETLQMPMLGGAMLPQALRQALPHTCIRHSDIMTQTIAPHPWGRVTPLLNRGWRSQRKGLLKDYSHVWSHRLSAQNVSLSPFFGTMKIVRMTHQGKLS
ncbi:hypothetical protein EI94DRAFT_1705030 [Lactarius quietus]|nr:hypothetical protein EI94DRAFT_1705030 [Lactarius quietus]